MPREENPRLPPENPRLPPPELKLRPPPELKPRPPRSRTSVTPDALVPDTEAGVGVTPGAALDGLDGVLASNAMVSAPAASFAVTMQISMVLPRALAAPTACDGRGAGKDG
jgi:hypothetical protein